LFGLTLTRGRSEVGSPIARRWTIHLLARLAIAAMCTSSAAAFDAGHFFRAAGVIARRNHPLEVPKQEIGPNNSQSLSPAVEVPCAFTTARSFFARSQAASQREIAFQTTEPEEIGKQ
jgi:hypothetical protein